MTELTELLNLTGWPEGMRVIARKERPHPGAQLRITDIDGHRVTAFATNTPTLTLAALELRHRRRARCEDRIRIAKDTGLTNLPLYSFAANQIWCAILALAVDLTAWMQLLALTNDDARRWEPKRLRHRLFTIPATLARGARQVTLHLAERDPSPSPRRRTRAPRPHRHPRRRLTLGTPPAGPTRLNSACSAPSDSRVCVPLVRSRIMRLIRVN